MQEILAHTPRWVFGLFIGLVALGIMQAKTRSVTMQRLTLLPLAMLGLSFYGVWNTFSGSVLGVTCWLGAALLTAVASQRIDFARGVRYVPEQRNFIMPGSWLPLALMMGIFFTKYGVGIVLARHGEWRDIDGFAAIVSLVYGFWSGMFFGRTAQIVVVHGRQALMASANAD
ncbi:MAG TPA: DUF6622 family protein [Burkholderiaceae bacterium]